MNNLIERFIVIFILVSIGIPIVLIGEYGIVLVFSFLYIGSILEYILILEQHFYKINNDYKIIFKFLFTMSPFLIFINILIELFSWYILLLIITIILYICIKIFTIQQILHMSYGVIWILPSMIICMMYGIEDQIKIIYICTMVWIADGGGLLIGKLVGKQKLLESVSPNKTIEGTIGGMIFSILTAYIFSLCFNRDYMKNYIIIGLICSIFGQIGDLIESAFKRKMNIKDSKMFFSPMNVFGGYLDRTDSIFIAIPIIYLYFLIQKI